MNGVIKFLDSKKRLHSRKKLGLIDRLGKKVVRSSFDPFDSFLGGIQRRHHHHGKSPRLRNLADFTAHLVAAHLGHHDIKKNQIGLFSVRSYPRLLAPMLRSLRRIL